jgi:hypothetical protein
LKKIFEFSSLTFIGCSEKQGNVKNIGQNVFATQSSSEDTEVMGIYNPSQSASKWHQTNEFWGTTGGFFTLSLAALGFGMNGRPMLAHLFFFASCLFGCVALWCICRTRRKHQIKTCALLAGILAITLISIDRWATRPITVADLPDSYKNELSGFQIDVQAPVYEANQKIAGVSWIPGSLITTLFLKPKDEIFNVNLTLSFRGLFVHGQQMSNVPDVYFQPKVGFSISSFSVTPADKNAKPFYATPEELSSGYPTSLFVYRQSQMFPDSPVTLALVGGKGYQNGRFQTAVPDSAWCPTYLGVVGTYDIRYKGTTLTVPVNFHMERKHP